MVFSSLEFLFFFLPIVLLLYYVVPYKIKNIVLLVASLIFYAWGEPVYVFLMIFIEAPLTFLLISNIFNLAYSKKQKYIYICCLLTF